MGNTGPLFRREVGSSSLVVTHKSCGSVPSSCKSYVSYSADQGEGLLLGNWESRDIGRDPREGTTSTGLLQKLGKREIKVSLLRSNMCLRNRRKEKCRVLTVRYVYEKGMRIGNEVYGLLVAKSIYITNSTYLLNTLLFEQILID